MSPVTLTKRFTGGEDLVVIPKRDYDRFLRVYKKYGWDTKEREADADIREGRVSHAFKTKKTLLHALNKLKKK